MLPRLIPKFTPKFTPKFAPKSTNKYKNMRLSLSRRLQQQACYHKVYHRVYHTSQYRPYQRTAYNNVINNTVINNNNNNNNTRQGDESKRKGEEAESRNEKSKDNRNKDENKNDNKDQNEDTPHTTLTPTIDQTISVNPLTGKSRITSKSHEHGAFHMLKGLKEGGKVMGRGGPPSQPSDAAQSAGPENSTAWKSITGKDLTKKQVTLDSPAPSRFVCCVSFKQFGYNVSLSWVKSVKLAASSLPPPPSPQPPVAVYNVIVGEGGVMRFFQPLLVRGLVKSTEEDMMDKTIIYNPSSVSDFRTHLGIENTLTGYVYGVKDGNIVWVGAGEPEEGEVEELLDSIT
mmetsp:Transcript_10145/g.20770  ORF Transcript_10145/g.20770 Transcript_10145/m.20770 type:complete len:344 (+) Transcript_10145:166-1197(+)